mmetsp:Transcript_18362/g.23130  ORF Transcript_18362/g.23130 Transcript_18362/m.23130 type:complete len:369 (+) Transcript_18362:1-1107(+)
MMNPSNNHSGEYGVQKQVMNTHWTEVVDSKTGRKLYHDQITGRTTFEKPNELKNAAEIQRDTYLSSGILPQRSNSTTRLQVQNEAKFGASDFDFDDRDERQNRVYSMNETQGYLDPSSYQATSSKEEISQDNVGFKMLQKMGWKKGKGLGKEGKGIKAPVQLQNNDAGDTLGLGKANEYDKKIDTAAKQRKKLEVEIKETQEMVDKRIAQAEKVEAIKQDIKDMNKEFYCETCCKQYKNVAEMSNHLSSYDHHHKKRFKEMREAERARQGGGGGGERKRKREQQRQEKELQRRMQAANSAALISNNNMPSGSSAPVPIVASSENKKLAFSFTAGAKKPINKKIKENTPGALKRGSGTKPVKFGFSFTK